MLTKILNYLIALTIIFIIYLITNIFIEPDISVKYISSTTDNAPSGQIKVIEEPFLSNLYDYFRPTLFQNTIKNVPKDEGGVKNSKTTYIELKEKISGIVIKDNESIIIIEGQFYKEGQKFQDMTITKIMKDKVYLKKNNKNYVMYLKE